VRSFGDLLWGRGARNRKEGPRGEAAPGPVSLSKNATKTSVERDQPEGIMPHLHSTCLHFPKTEQGLGGGRMAVPRIIRNLRREKTLEDSLYRRAKGRTTMA